MSRAEPGRDSPGEATATPAASGDDAASALAARGIALRPSWLAALPKIVLPFAAVLAVAFLVEKVLTPALGIYRSKVMVDIGINIVLAVSLQIVNGFTGQFSIGHAGFMALGGYAAGVVTYYGSFRLWGSANEHEWGGALFLLACVVGGLVAAVAGYVVGLPSLRLRGDYLAIVTLGFGEIFRVLIQRTDDALIDPEEVAQTPWLGLAFDKDGPHLNGLVGKVGGALGFTGLPFYTSPLSTYLFVGLTLLVAYRLKVSSWGRAFLSVRENEIAAEAMGINTTKVKVRAFVVAAFFAGIAGSLFAHETGSTLNPRELGFQKSFDVIIMVVLGGLGSVSGATLAAILVTILPEILREVADYRLIVFALLLIVMMIVRPQGLFGIREVWDFFPRKTPATPTPPPGPTASPKVSA